ncbi:MAG: FAD-dependent thymidylate synthase [Candidatus Thermoplasmatota archaeon]|nr:FAD-dependent thymidylate synthase [Candidatus Thermoplasmatota archaeon]
MKVRLAGATMDRRFWKEDRAATPETISAAYARLSHSPRTVPELRDDAVSEVDRARRSNENIVYRMGHSSVAEHAVFNIDVEDASRLLVEFIERHRIASFTERSQRYVFFGDKTFIIPEEIRSTDLEARVIELEKEKFELYNDVVSREDLKERFGERLLEQARYILGLTCPTDLGLTVNARETEYIISQGLAHPLSEVRSFATALLEATAALAPSLIKYTDGNYYTYRTSEEIARTIEGMARFEVDEDGRRQLVFNPNRRAVCSDLPSQVDDPESEVAAGLIFENSDLSFEEARCLVRNMSDEQLTDILLPVFRNYPVHASLPRAFEMMDLTFDFEISASGFAQLKRHRMATLIVQRYNPGLWETPDVFMDDRSLLMRYWDIMKRSRDLYNETKGRLGIDVAQYVLTNGHKRRVVFKLNLRELYHFVRLRSDHHAQDEIRRVSDMIVGEAMQRFPIVTSMLCGKDGFEKSKGRILGCEGASPEPEGGKGQ